MPARRRNPTRSYFGLSSDGIHLQARLEDEKQCIRVLIGATPEGRKELVGATPEGRKELVGFTDGARESAQDWRDLLLELKRRGLDVPRLAPNCNTFFQPVGQLVCRHQRTGDL